MTGGQRRMRLAKVTIAGFKSFADRTEFRFDDPITGIVGPNGCGKSNVVDAIKWVLGERSSKSLRGKEMIDVIFAGSAGRKPLGMASVTLTFENPIVEPRADVRAATEVPEVAVEGESPATDAPLPPVIIEAKPALVPVDLAPIPALPLDGAAIESMPGFGGPRASEPQS